MSEEAVTTGWSIGRAQRRALLDRFPPAYATVRADHVTLAARGPPDTPPPAPKTGRIVGRADDGEGVEAYVVEIDRTTARPDGGRWHITWSLGPDRRGVESNRVIAEHGWTPIEPVEVRLTPARF